MQKIYDFLSNKQIQFLFKLSVFIIIIFILTRDLNYYKILEKINFSENFIFFFALVFVLIFSINFLILIRWHILINKLNDTKISVYKLINPVIYGIFFGEFSFLGTFISRTFLLLPLKINIKNILISTFYEKVLSFLFLLIFIIPSILFLFFRDTQIYIGLSLYLIYFIFITIIFCFICLINYKVILNYVLEINTVNKFIKSGAILSVKDLKLPMLLTLLIQFTGYFCLLLIPAFFSFELNLFNYALLLPLLMFFSSIPITISDWGWREIIFIYALNFVDITKEEAFIISVTFGLVTLLNSLFTVTIYEVYLRTSKYVKA